MRSIGWAAAAVLAAAGAARAGIDAEVPGTVKAKSTINPSGEVETYRFPGARGTLLSFKVAAAKKAPLVFTVSLFDGNGDRVAFDEGTVTDAGSKFQVIGSALPSTGQYRLEVSATGTGDYALALKTKPQTKWTGTLEFTDAGPLDFAFAAPPGSSLALRVKSTDGASDVPRLGILEGDGFEMDLTDVQSTTATSASATVADAGDAGEYTLHVSNAGGPGTAAVTVKVKPAKSKPAKLDLRASSLGHPSGGGETLIARTLDEGGGTVSVEDPEDPLFGASVTIPEGDLPGDTPISVGSAEAPVPPADDDQAAGPAVDLQPSGITFDVPVTVTLPYDPALIPDDATAADIRVLIVEDDGSSHEAIPTGVDEEAGTLTVETSGFSVCIPVIESGPPRLGLNPGGDEYWLLQNSGEVIPDDLGDSRNRRVGVALGEASIYGDGTFQFSYTETRYTWSNSTNEFPEPPISSGLALGTKNENGSATWSYGASGQTISLATGDQFVPPTFRLSRDGNYMAGRADASPDPQAEVVLLVRKNLAPLADADLDGTWHLLLLEYDADQDADSGAAVVKASRGYGTMTFDGLGGCRLTVTERGSAFNPSNGTWSQPSETITFDNGTYGVEEAGTVLVNLPPQGGEESATELRLYPGPGADVMIASDSVPGISPMGIVLVRQGSDMGTSSLNGDYLGAEYGVDPESYSPASSGLNIADLEVGASGSSASFDGGSSAPVSFDEHRVRRDTGQATGVQVDNGPFSTTLSVSVAKNGKATLSTPDGSVVAAVAPSGSFVVYVSNPSSANTDFGMGFFLKAPPDKTPK